MAATGYSGRRRMSTFFIEGSDIHKDVIMTDATQYLGEVASVESGGRWDADLGRQLYGYYITAYRPPTWDHMQQLRRDSAAWSSELERRTYGKGTIPVQVPYPGTLRMNSVLSENSPSVTDPHRNGSPPQAYNMYIPSPISYSHPPPHMQSQSSTAPSIEENVKDIVLIHPQNGNSYDAAALLDTGRATDNWISSKMVRRLGAEGFVSYGPSAIWQAPNGGVVQSKGDIQLTWRWALTGTNFSTSTFYVADVENFDVMIANEYMEQKHLQFWHPESSNHLTKYNPAMSPYEPPILCESTDPSRAIRRTDDSEEIRQALLEPEPEKAKMKLDKENMDMREPERIIPFNAYGQYY